MATVQVTSREFRDKQASLLELADKGDKIVIRRGKKKSYTLVATDDDDLYFSPQMQLKIDQSLQELRDGKTLAMNKGETLDEFLSRAEQCIS